MDANKLTFWGITSRTIAVHTITYFFVGILAYTLLDYRTLFAGPELGLLMKPTDDPMVMAGPLFQPVRGIFFGLVFYLLRDVLFGRQNGWLIMWIVLVVVGIFSTFGPSPGSIEGFVYTRIPAGVQLIGLIEVLIQSLLLSILLFYWVKHPEKRWLTSLVAIVFCIVVALPVLGMLAG